MSVFNPAALFFLLSAPLLYGLNTALLKRGSSQIPPFTAMVVSMSVLLALSLVSALFFERRPDWQAEGTRSALSALLLVGVVNTGAFWCLLKAYQYASVWQYQLFALLTPIFAAVFAYYIVNEPISPRLFLGLGFVGVGLCIALR